MMSLSEMLTAYNEKAPEFNLKTRKSFRNRKEAFEALSKVGITPPEPDPESVTEPDPEPYHEDQVDDPSLPDTDPDQPPIEEQPAIDDGDDPPTEPRKKKAKAKSKPKVKKAATKKPTKKAAKKKEKSKDARRITDDDNGVLAEFQILRDSKQHKVLMALLKGDPLSMKKLAAIAGSAVGATSAIVAGIDAKTKGRLLRGGKRPPYKLIKSKEEGELIIALIKEK